MNILYIHQYFVTPRQQGGTRSYEIARFLLSKGHNVTMITSGLRNAEFPVRHGEKITEYDADGIKVLSIRAGYNDARAGTSMAGWKRMLSFHHFAWLAAQAGKRLKEVPDIIFATHTPLMIGFAGILLRHHYNRPFVFEIRDLWPEALINIGVLRSRFVAAYLRNMSKYLYKTADHLSAASPGMKEGILRYGIPDNKVTVVTNASDLTLFHPDIDGSAERRRLALENRFAAIYFGAHGEANGLDYLLEAATELKRRGRNDIVLVLHGDGGTKMHLKNRADREQLDNVVFSDPVPLKEEMSRIVAACDACMTIYRASKEVTWSPNKLFDAFAAGKPVLINVPGWLGETVEKNECGLMTHPTDATSFVDAILKLADDRQLCAQFSKNSRKIAEEVFARDKQAAKLEEVFLHLTSKRTN